MTEMSTTPDIHSPVRMSDLAEAAGVSLSTVSRIFSGNTAVEEATRKKVLHLADEMGYRRLRRKPLRNHRGAVHGNIGMLVSPFMMSGEVRQDGSIYQPLFSSLHEVTEDEGFQAMFASVGDNPDEPLPLMIRNRRVDGLLLVCYLYPEMLAKLAEALPLVAVNRVVRRADVPSFCVDNHLMLNQAVEHLHRLGHERILYFDVDETIIPPIMRGWSHVAERWDGYRRAMIERGLEAHIAQPQQFGYNEEAPPLEALATRIAENPATAPTAIIGGLSYMFKFSQFALRLGLDVPRQVSLLAIDDSSLATLAHPPLSTFSSNHATAVQLAVRCLLDRIDGKDPDALQTRVEPIFTQRQSTAPPGA